MLLVRWDRVVAFERVALGGLDLGRLPASIKVGVAGRGVRCTGGCCRTGTRARVAAGD